MKYKAKIQNSFTGILILLLLVINITGCSSNQSVTPEKQQVSINNHVFEIETAKTPEEQMQGLQNVEELADNKGMLFINQEEEMKTFWMYKTLIPLDIIFIDKDLRIINIETATPCESIDAFKCAKYSSKKPAQYILEINAGLSQTIGIKTNDKLITNIL
jgi:uncharacterized membrane protein (UPF0127 family)